LFHLQAGRSRLLAGQATLGLPSLKRGLELFAERQQYQKLDQFGAQMIAELNEHGLKNEAADIETWLKHVLPVLPSAPTPTKRPTLPAHCPSCGAPVRPDEVDWQPDDVTAECGYCGSPVR
jgi:hypothetical protein